MKPSDVGVLDVAATNGTRPVDAAVPPVGFEHEELVIRRGARSGAQMIVAIHSTALGPALGGLRIWAYPSPADGVRDALRLARGMTFKAAASGLDLGGGKGVVCAPQGSPPVGEERRGLLLDFADLVESLGGRYITAEDVGTTPDDLMTIRERTEFVTGHPVEHGGSGDPSPYTAIGVEAAMRACVRDRLGVPALEGLRVAVVGLGNVGAHLARRLHAAGAELVVSDVNEDKHAVAHALGAEWADPSVAIGTECDVLAPCALGGAIDRESLTLLRCKVVCGCANNQLADDRLAEALAGGGILYAPDFIANAGGLINVSRELHGHSEEDARESAMAIGVTMDRILVAAASRSITPLTAAYELAEERLSAAVRMRH